MTFRCLWFRDVHVFVGTERPNNYARNKAIYSIKSVRRMRCKRTIVHVSLLSSSSSYRFRLKRIVRVEIVNKCFTSFSDFPNIQPQQYNLRFSRDKYSENVFVIIIRSFSEKGPEEKQHEGVYEIRKNVDLDDLYVETKICGTNRTNNKTETKH